MTRGRYTLGYGSDMVRGMSSRTGQHEAAFFLPYLDEGMRLLDCGCGPGTITAELAAHVAPGEVIGIDLDDKQFAKGRQRAQKRGLTNVSFAVGNVYDLAYPDDSVDAVFAHGVVYHLAEPERALAEMRRVLRPGGLIGIRDSDEGGTLFTPSSELLERGFNVIVKAQRHYGADPHFGRRHRALLRAQGFELVRASASYDCYSTEPETQALGRVLADLLPQQHMADVIVDNGWATRAELKEMSRAFLSWGQDRDAFWARARCEAVAKKA